jgi:protein TonB
LFPLAFSGDCAAAPNFPCRNSGAGRQVGGDAGRELAATLGVYRNVFEQSLLLDQDSKRPWNFLASLGAELLVVSLALLIPLLYRDHLPSVHWKDIITGPAPLPEPFPLARASGRPSPIQARSLPQLFRPDLDRTVTGAEQHATLDFAIDAPPGLASGPLAGETNMLGRFIPNIVAPPPKPTVEAPKPSSAPVPVGGDVQMAKLLRKVIPVYPAIARAARISGIVRLIGTIGKDGAIRNLQLVSGHPMLARAALDAVQQWIYKPTLLNGNPVEVIAPIEVSFTLGP